MLLPLNSRFTRLSWCDKIRCISSGSTFGNDSGGDRDKPVVSTLLRGVKNSAGGEIGETAVMVLDSELSSDE